MANDQDMPRKAIAALVPGDFVDLENDPHADNGEHPEFEYELQEVIGIERESADCIRVDFANLSVGFPPDHTVPVFVDSREVGT